MSKDKTNSSPETTNTRPLYGMVDPVDIKVRLPRELEQRLRMRAAARYQDRSEYLRELVIREMTK